ncbi:MAG: uracil-DNA glycosylase [Deltaproteobacteria bacterium]|nr:uracil-DNA glycosylase [Deltaproteobacteria bacterium]
MQDCSVQTLETIRAKLGDCKRCALGQTRKNIVFGEGSANAGVMFIGEAPGATEDASGKPFVGPAGRLLTNIIQNGMGLSRQDVYIANILKCRPPGNRDPLPGEVEQCIGFLEAQIKVIQPRLIIALGRVAAQNLLGTKDPLNRIRGIFQDYRGIVLMPTYHPSYLLQNPAKKRDVWEDIKKVMEHLGLPVLR